MSAEMLDAIYDLQVNGYFSWHANNRPPERSVNKARSIPPCVIGQAIGSHKQYLMMLKRIESLNQSETVIR